ncbi:MAG TPA: prenyltransferase [Blastocatellia bacterium]|nr:prenyltransferase [Blastocatellia bacterium]
MEEQRLNFVRGLWRLADPRITLASMSSLFLGACAARSVGSLDWGWLGLTVGGIASIEVAKNASGEVFDYDSGADLRVAPEDRSPFSGGKRVLVDGLLTRNQTVRIAVFFYSVGALIGLAIVCFREPGVLWIGLIGVACAYFYHAPPFNLSYRGLGELVVGICYGPLISLGTYLVQQRALSMRLALLATPLGILIASFLWINEFPDSTADKASGKRTLVVRLGRPKAAVALAFLVGASYITLAVLPLFGLPRGVWLGALGLPLAAISVRRSSKHPEKTEYLILAQALLLWAFVLCALGSGIGLLLSLRD